MQLTKEQIPSDISTVEELVAWALMLLDNQANGMTIKEDAGLIPVPVSQLQIATVADNTTRFIGRISIELKQEWQTNRTVKLWKQMKELVTTSIPANFTTN